MTFLFFFYYAIVLLFIFLFNYLPRLRPIDFIKVTVSYLYERYELFSLNIQTRSERVHWQTMSVTIDMRAASVATGATAEGMRWRAVLVGNTPSDGDQIPNTLSQVETFSPAA